MSGSDVERTESVALEGPCDVEYPVRSDQLTLVSFGKDLIDSRWGSREETIWKSIEAPTEDVDKGKGDSVQSDAAYIATVLQRFL